VIVIAIVVVAVGIAFWRSATNLQGHTRAGAEVIVAALGRPLRGEPAVSSEGEERVRAGQEAAVEQSLAHIYDMIPGLGEPVPTRIRPGDYAVDKSLSQLDLRDVTDATVLVIAREGEPVMLPIGREVIRAGDVLALAGTPDAVEAARKLLAEGPAAGSGATDRL
jgi:CPA2 family monovalent cation:H+ antiporter-2